MRSTTLGSQAVSVVQPKVLFTLAIGELCSRLRKLKMSKYQQIWNEVVKLLKEAHGYLDTGNSSVETIDDNEFNVYLENNELELAIDEIEAIAESFEVPKEFWQCLLKAANRMKLKEHSRRYVEMVGYF